MKKYLSALLLIFLIGVFANNSVSNVNASESTYVVNQGDTLYSIGKQHNISVSELKNFNGITGSTIQVGQKLNIPFSDGKTYYQVKPGDTLFSISKSHSISVEKLKELNKLKDNLIGVGQKIDLGQPSLVTVSYIKKSSVMSEVGFSSEEIELLARMIHAEARGESYEGKVGVGAVIINRIKSSEFPNNMKEVIYQRTKNGYQFSPVQDGSINLKSDDISIKAAHAAIAGQDPTGGSLYFYNPKTATDKWITTLPVSTKIGNHLFAR